MYRQILDTEHKRKSALITLIILLLLLVGMFSLGMQYLDPPEEYGVAINFGNIPMSKENPVEKSKSTLPKSQEKTVEKVKEEVKEEVAKKVPADKIVTNTTAKDVPVISQSKKETKQLSKSVKEIPKKVEKPNKPSKAAMDALNSLLGGEASKSAGDDKKEGVKGSKEGDKKSSKYYRNSNKRSDGNYNLSGRKALSKPIKKPNCEEEGIVVVTIFVNQQGKVVKAVPGEQGTTNSEPCLFEAAKKAALATQWNPDKKAPKLQKGDIIYKFSLSK